MSFTGCFCYHVFSFFMSMFKTILIFISIIRITRIWKEVFLFFLDNFFWFLLIWFSLLVIWIIRISLNNDVVFYWLSLRNVWFVRRPRLVFISFSFRCNILVKWHYSIISSSCHKISLWSFVSKSFEHIHFLVWSLC